MLPEVLLSALLLKEQILPKHEEPACEQTVPEEHVHEEAPLAESTDAKEAVNLPPQEAPHTFTVRRMRKEPVVQVLGPNPRSYFMPGLVGEVVGYAQTCDQGIQIAKERHQSETQFRTTSLQNQPTQGVFVEALDSGEAYKVEKWLFIGVPHPMPMTARI